MPARRAAPFTPFLLLAALGLAAAAEPQDWPQWRGPGRDGRIPGLAARTAWPREPVAAWRVKVGLGHSSPVVVGDRVYQFSREGESEVVRALALATGRELWRQSYAAPYRMNPAATSHGPGPKSTPVVADGRVFTLGISGILSAWDAGSGRLAWRKSFESAYRADSPLYGAAMSPVVDHGRVIAHVGGHDDGALVALDAASGDLAWSWSGDGPGYASPIVASFDGVRQVVTQTQRSLVGVAAGSGELLWRQPLTTPYDQNSVTPVVDGGVVYYTGLDAPLAAGRPVRQGTAWRLEPVWSNPEVSGYLSTPVLVDGRLYGLSQRQKGRYFCVDAASGRTLWQSDGRQAENAAVVAGGGALYLLDTDGTLVVAAAATDGFRVLARLHVADQATWAHPVVRSDGVLVKDVDTLAFLRIN